jgi:hypothetical protein
MTRSKILVLLLGIATLSACSKHVDNQEISGFSNGVDAVVSSYRAFSPETRLQTLRRSLCRAFS